MALSSHGRHRPHLWVVPREPTEHVRRARFTNPLWLVFGVLGGPLAWAVSYALIAALLSPACSASNPTVLGLSGVEARELLVAAAGALVAIGAGLISLHIFRRVAMPEEETTGGSIGQTAFWALGGTFLSAVCLFAIAATGAAAVTLSGFCA